MLGVVITLDQMMPGSTLGLYSRTKLVNCTGQERRTRFADNSRTERTGKGSTVVVMLVLLFAGAGSEKPLPRLARLVIVPVDWGVTMSVTVTEPPVATVGKLPRIGLPLVVRVPWLALADLRVTEEGRVFVRLTLGAASGPLFVIMMV